MQKPLGADLATGIAHSILPRDLLAKSKLESPVIVKVAACCIIIYSWLGPSLICLSTCFFQVLKKMEMILNAVNDLPPALYSGVEGECFVTVLSS